MTSKFSIDNRELLQRISSGEAVVGIDFGNLIVSGLAAFRLAAMDSEPVGYFGRFDHDDEDLIDQCSKNVKGAFPLYRHAQPAPVVPDEVTAEDCPAFVEYEVAEVDEAWSRGFNACRAAMLATAPQSPGGEPATVPGKWIPVSERMPEVGDIVLTAMGGVVNVGEMECSAANCRFFTSVISGRELPATHWMPLPAAPQEVNRE